MKLIAKNSNGFFDSDDFRKFNEWQDNWILTINNPQSVGSSDNSTGPTKKESSRENAIYELIKYLNDCLGNLVNQWGIEVIRIIAHRIIESIIQEQVFLRIELEVVTEVFKSVLLALKRAEPSLYSTLNNYSIFSSETYNLISQNVANNNINVNQVKFEYWKTYYDNMGSAQSRDKFELRSMLLVIQMMKNKKIRIKKMKSRN